MTTISTRRTAASICSVAVLATAALTGAPATADPPAYEVVAQGLDNPRLLSFTGDKLYVAEAGKGGDGPCIDGPEGPACYGRSGALTLVTNGAQSRVIKGMPSLAGKDGSGAIGPADIEVTKDGRFVMTIGLGADPAVRKQFEHRAKLLATVTTGRLGADDQKIKADLGAYEAQKDPDHGGADSNPTGLAKVHGGWVVTDSGGNTLVRKVKGGGLKTLAVFPARDVPLGTDIIAMQAVPTSVVRGRDGAYYVSQLTGFPFPAGGARIYRVVPGHAPTVYASGLTNVTDLAWRAGKLYAVQISDEGLSTPGLPSGSLVRIDPGGSATTVADDLPAPYGVAMHAGSAYVTVCAVCAGGGQVVRIPLG